LRNKEIKEPSGWQGNIFYPDGPGGQGFGIEILPNGRVWFPCISSVGKNIQGMRQESKYRVKKSFANSDHVS